MSDVYVPKPIDTTGVELAPELLEITERIAANVHDVWAAARIAEGWKYGHIRNDKQKEHPYLVEYTDLPESEKAYDRNTAMETLKIIRLFGFEIKKE